jgi:hypothetical protein
MKRLEVEYPRAKTEAEKAFLVDLAYRTLLKEKNDLARAFPRCAELGRLLRR